MNVRSDFSIGESMLQIKPAIKRLKELGYESACLVDTMTVSSLVDFSNEAKKAGLRPIVGVRIRVVEDPTYRKPAKSSGEVEKPNPMYFLKAYPLNDNGMKSLMKLLSKANSEEYFYYHARVGLEDVLALEDCAVSTGDLQTLWHIGGHETIMSKLQAAFNGTLFVEVVPIATPLFDKLNKMAFREASVFCLPLVATYPSFYLDDAHADTAEVLAAITSNTQMDAGWRSIQYVRNFSVKAPNALAERAVAASKRMEARYGAKYGHYWMEALENVQRLATVCGYEFKKQAPSLPVMAEDEFAELMRQIKAGWVRRFSESVLGHKPSAGEMDAYKGRLRYELSVLKDMGFSNYFLLVQDLVMWAKQNDIIVGPGRGSVGGSLVAYLLGITDVDPIRFNLFFERFINPERQDLPDADLDFMSEKRHLVIEYLRTKYGEDRVAGISNYSTLASASALRDAGRVFGYEQSALSCTKLVPKEHGRSFTLDEAAGAVPEIDKFKADNPDLWRHATRLEGAMRSLGQHAAGVIVGGEPIVNRAVVESRTGGSVVNWDKRSVEDWGLIKMDILGLSTLDTLELAKNMIFERHGVKIDYIRLPLDDEKVLKEFGKGNTSGVFQFDSPGMKKLLKDLALGGTLTFDDISAATALYRPGPLDSGLLDDFVAIKQGVRDVSYIHPAVEGALKETYGVIVYQEQVMQVARDLCGFTMAEADNLRKAIGKKDAEKMASMGEKFVEGAITLSGLPRHQASDLWEAIMNFAAYSFNKSHSVEYSIISMWTMWLKVYYTQEFFAASMTTATLSSGDADAKLHGLVRDARENGIEVYPPDINRSSGRFEVRDEKTILAPFQAIKGVSENTVKVILEARAKADGEWFKTKEEFLSLVNKTKCNRRHQEVMERVGVFASVTEGATPAKHPERMKDQLELMPGLIIDAMKAERTIAGKDKFLLAKLQHILNDVKACEGCDLKDKAHPLPGRGGAANLKFMVVFDCPSWQEESSGQIMKGDGSAFVRAALKEAGLSPADGYFTTLVRARKEDKFLSNGQINACSGYLQREVDLMKPPVIIALGAAALRYFEPTIKGSANEHIGKTIYMPKLDATLVCGLNPAQIAFDPSKQSQLDAVFKKVAGMVL